MRPWNKLNATGKLLLGCCLVNILAAVAVAMGGSLFCLFPFFCGMYCGLMTLSPKYQK